MLSRPFEPAAVRLPVPGLCALLLVATLAGCGGGGGSSSAANGIVSNTSGAGSASSGSGGASSGSGGASSGSGGASSGSGGSGGSTSQAVPITGNDALRLADQAAFGPTASLVADIAAQGSAWIDAQIATPATGYPVLPYITTSEDNGCPSTLGTQAVITECLRENYSVFPIARVFFKNALSGPDQLRQRVALAYSEIFVVSTASIDTAYAMREYQQMLLNDAFVNFRQLLEDVTLHPTMGEYLNMANNHKANASGTVSPNENYAREVMQLFSIGTVQLNPDGSPVLQNGVPVPTYTQDTVEGFASAFTGWTYPTAPGATASANNPIYSIGSMIPVDQYHDTNAKSLLNGTVLPAGQNAATDLKGALDNIFNHPNVGPFIGRQLIQFLVTSNPSPAYIARITAVFNNDGTGTRGNMAAVIKAILMDPEARGAAATSASFGHLREPVVDAAAVLRALGGTTDGEWPFYMARAEGQGLFGPPSVFSYYSPDNALPGGSGLVAPQFGLINTSSTITRLNSLNALLFSATGIAPDSTLAGATGTQVNVTAYQALAANPSALVGQINANLLHGALTTTEAGAIVTAVSAIPATQLLARTNTALYLAMASPRYQIVR